MAQVELEFGSLAACTSEVKRQFINSGKTFIEVSERLDCS